MAFATIEGLGRSCAARQAQPGERLGSRKTMSSNDRLRRPSGPGSSLVGEQSSRCSACRASFGTPTSRHTHDEYVVGIIETGVQRVSTLNVTFHYRPTRPRSS